MEEMLEEANTLLSRLAPRQTRYKVTERPDLRTIRYYVSQGLLPRPISYEGGRARYGGSHVLRLLYVKKMQAGHLTLPKIAALLKGLEDTDVLDAVLDRAATETGSVPGPPRAGENAATPYRRIKLSQGVSVDIPETLYAMEAGRKALADELENVARSLRSGHNEEGERK